MEVLENWPKKHVQKIVVMITGDGERTSWDIPHGMDTFDIVYNIREGHRHGISAHVVSNGPNSLNVRFKEPLDKHEEVIFIVMS